MVNHEPGEGKFLLHFPINHVAGAVEIAYACIYSGVPMVLMDKFDAAATLATIAKEKITVLGQVPAMFLLEFKVPDFDSYDLSSIRNYMWAGAAAPEGMVKKLAATGATLVTGYGQTENAGFITYSKPGDSMDDLIKTVGKCDDAFEIKLMNNDGKEVPKGEVGEIWMKGDLVMKGYWNNPSATAETIVEGGWLRSGDLATMDERGYITIVGRTKEMFKSGGYNVYPAGDRGRHRDAPQRRLRDHRPHPGRDLAGGRQSVYHARSRHRDQGRGAAGALQENTWPTTRCPRSSRSGRSCRCFPPARSTGWRWWPKRKRNVREAHKRIGAYAVRRADHVGTGLR